MKEILYICPSSGIGGAETFLKQTFSEADKTQFRNHYLVFKKGPLYDDLLDQGASVEILSRVPRLSKKEDRKMVAEKIKSIINNKNIDLVHSTMAYGALFSARICKQMKTPHVWFQHGPVSGWMDRLAAILPHSGLIVNSHHTGQAQRRLENPVRFLIPRKIPIEKILLGTNLQKPSEANLTAYREKIFSDLNINKEAVIVGMLCRIQSWKGVHLLVESIRKLSTQDLPTHHVIVWGEAFNGTEYLEQLKQEVKKHQLPVSFPGKTTQPELSLSLCDIIVNASIQPEPFGLAIIEGMTMGAVPLVPDEGGPVEIVSNGKTGLTYKASQTASLTRQLKTLILDSNLRERLSEQALMMAEQKFRASRALSHLQTFYGKILNH